MNIGNLFALNGEIRTQALSVVCVQFAPIGAQTVEELNENTETVLNYLDMSVGAFPGADLVVFPEACFQGSLRSTLKTQSWKKTVRRCGRFRNAAASCPYGPWSTL